MKYPDSRKFLLSHGILYTTSFPLCLVVLYSPLDPLLTTSFNVWLYFNYLMLFSSGDISSHRQQREGADSRARRVPGGHRRLPEMVEGQELEGPGRSRSAHHRRAIRGPGVATLTPTTPTSNGPPASHAPCTPAVSGLDPEGEERTEGRVQILLKKATNKQTIND